MFKKITAGLLASSFLGAAAAAPVYAATTSTSTSHVYTQTFRFSNWNDINQWLDQFFSNQSSTQTAQIPVQKPVTTSTQTPVQKSVSTSQVASNPSNTASSDVQQVVNLVNQQREKNGLAPLKLSTSLDNVAQSKAQDMINENYFGHTSPKYGSPFNMMSEYGIHYSYAGENIAAGQADPTTVMQDWMNSPGHRANILNKNYTEIGVGVAHGGSYGTYWVQEFISP